ncbi:MAG: N-acetylglucosamine-6-phosphate deacetylase [Planctomyces sp.]|nr:N-acetylglucosamine-6-phosphate deacetylase [Planctomyces sp.]
MTSPHFFDLQINGYAGIDFNQPLSPEEWHNACAALQRDGVDGVLPTFITDSISAMSASIRSLVTAYRSDSLVRSIVAGVHIEGPFISPISGYIGAHPAEHARAANWDDMSALIDAADGLTKLVTLAPEQDPQQTVTRKLVASGIRVAAGHTNASLDELGGCIDAGLSLFTHLGNGCPQCMHRHDNIVQRALSRRDALHYSVIADGAHIPFFALDNYLRLAGIDRVIVVSDAISAAGCGPGTFQLGGQMVNVGEDGVPRAEDDSHFIGSASTMQQMADNLARELQLTEKEIYWLTSEAPRAYLDASCVSPVESNNVVVPNAPC